MKINLIDVADKLQSANNIIITSHINPDGDAIGSSLALMLILKSLHKNVSIYFEDNISFKFNHLPCADSIIHPTEKISADLLIILDTQLDRIGSVANLVQAPILNIDHHITNEGRNVDWLYLNPNSSATCEIIFDLIKLMNIDLTIDIATCLYTGLATDTGFFNFSNTKPSTLRTAADLIAVGVKPNEIAESMERKSLNDFKGLVEALQTVKFYFDSKVCGMLINEELFNRIDSTEGMIDSIRVIDGVEIAFIITCKENNLCRVSMRSKSIDVSAIAHNLGGGGHVKAAGCTITTSLPEAEIILLNEIEKAIK